MRNALLTGFPGLLGQALARLLAREVERLTLLVEHHQLVSARRIAARWDRGGARVEIVPADVGMCGLSLPARLRDRLRREVDTVFHLAAVCHPAVDPPTAERVNVRGTRHVSQLATELDGLRRYHYLSDAAVAGRRTGIVHEDELEHRAGFFNYYESSKYEAERSVRRLLEDGAPVSVYRPVMVVGSTVDGWTTRFDGLYHLMGMLRGLPWPLDQVNPGSREVELPVVPVDFVARAVLAIARREDSVGQTFQLTDPSPPTTAEVCEQLARALHGRGSLARLPLSATRLLAAAGLPELLGVPPEAHPYFFHRCRFDCVHTLDALDGSGVRCPPFAEYVDRLVRYYLHHARDGRHTAGATPAEGAQPDPESSSR